jgi:hypothetical protein
LVGDEISGAPGPGSRRSRTALLVLLAAAVVVAGVVSLRRGVEPLEVRAPTSPPAAQMPPLPGQVPPAATGPLEVPALSVGEVCQPPRTDGRTRLDLSFTLVNTVDRPVTLVRVEPLFPLAGLRALATELRSGSCTAPGPKLRSDEVRGRGTMLVVFRLGLPTTCPAPLPVQATVAVRLGSRHTATDFPLLSDLGGIHFATC